MKVSKSFLCKLVHMSQVCLNKIKYYDWFVLIIVTLRLPSPILGSFKLLLYTWHCFLVFMGTETFHTSIAGCQTGSQSNPVLFTWHDLMDPGTAASLLQIPFEELCNVIVS